MFDPNKKFTIVYGRGIHPIKMIIVEQNSTWYLTGFEDNNFWMRDELMDEVEEHKILMERNGSAHG